MDSYDFQRKIDSLQSVKDRRYKELVDGAKKCDDLIRDYFWKFIETRDVITICRSDIELRFSAGECVAFYSDADYMSRYNNDDRCKSGVQVTKKLLDNKIKTTDGKVIATVSLDEEYTSRGSFGVKVKIVGGKK